MTNIIRSSVSDIKVSYNEATSENNSSNETISAEVNQVLCTDVDADTLDTCPNTTVALDPITTGVVAKIPVVLAEFTVRFNVTSKIRLPEEALEIKNIKKRIKVTQCLLLQNTNVLFIKGFIRKNIDYSTRNCSNSEGICGDLRHCTVDVPFQCTTNVTFNGTPPAPVISNNQTEFEYFREQKLPREFAEKDKLLSGDLSEFNQESFEYFNELPYCELIRSRIVEFDEYLDRRKIVLPAPFEERLFDEIEEKMVIFLTLKLLQNRQVAIDPTCNGGSVCRSCDVEEESEE